MNNLAYAHLRNLSNLINNYKDLTDEQKLKAFYHLTKYFTKKDTQTYLDFQLASLDEFLLTGVSIEKFVQFFPIEKTYDGAKYQIKDYYSTIKTLRENGSVIQDASEFLWNYHNRLIEHYLVEKMGIIFEVYRQETGKEPFEEFFGVTPHRLYEIDGKEFLFNPKTGKTIPVDKPKKRRPKWIRLIKSKGE